MGGGEHCAAGSQEGTSQLLLETAPVGAVLEGTVRARVIAAAHMCGLSVRETAPDPRQRASWSEAFVCNALRILQPVELVECPDGALSSPWRSVHQARPC